MEWVIEIVSGVAGSIATLLFPHIWKKAKNIFNKLRAIVWRIWDNPENKTLLHTVKQKRILKVIRSGNKRDRKKWKRHAKVIVHSSFGEPNESHSLYPIGLNVKEINYLDKYVLGISRIGVEIGKSKSFDVMREKNYVNRELYDAIKDYHDERVEEENIRLKRKLAELEAGMKDMQSRLANLIK